jgi:pSer/pThr/pTyr-binding forkhead associated (FHA) protein
MLDHRTRNGSIPLTGAPQGSYLSIEDADDLRLIPLERPITHVGRGLIADLRLEDAHVSRRHAIVARRGHSVRVLDDRSSNGTFVNGRQVSVADLSDGDVVRFGRVAFRYVVIEGRREKAAPRRSPIGRLRGRVRESSGTLV